MKKIVISILTCFVFPFANAQNFYDENVIQDLEINFTQSNWDYMLDTAKLGAGDYIMADWVKINGILYDSVGIRYKGNSSYDSAIVKNPLHIKLDEYKNHDHQGFESIKLSNGYGDPSCIREVLAYSILEKYMHCPQSNFAKVTINGNYIGLYSSSENIDKKFLGDHFYSSINTFLKCNPTGAPTPALKSNFKYISSDSTSYMPFYELKSDTGWHDFINFCNTATNTQNNLASELDIDRTIWMLAYNNLFINLDSYNGVYAQNHYTYKDATGHFNPIIWDLNMCFGAFPYAGTGAIGVGQKTLQELKDYSPFAHATEIAWPLINVVMADSTMKRKYIAHLKTMLQENIISGNYQTKATQFQSLIDNNIASDVNKLFSYTQFQNGLTNDVVFGNFTVPGIANLMEARKTYLQSLPEFAAAAPSISNYVSNPINPNYNQQFALTATITNTSKAYLGYRFDKTKKFQSIEMYDDGLHGDNAANDNIYGVYLNMLNGIMEYYIYAENTNAGMFAPQRAEHEFYTVGAMVSQPLQGEIVINELLADNVGKERDEYGATEDWAELYNTSNKILNLYGCFLTDELNQLNKWSFPNGTYLAPNSYLTVWLDDDSTQQILHTNFNLSKDSGHVLLSLPNQTILDSVSYGAQTTNVSYGRYPNGTGSFIGMNRTLGLVNNNDPLGYSNFIPKENDLISFPNPTNSFIYINSKHNQHYQLYDLQGRILMQGTISNQRGLTLSDLNSGTYILKCGNTFQKIIKL